LEYTKVCSEWYQRFELRAIDWNIRKYVQNGITDLN